MVDFPAPLPPSSAWTSPARTSKSTLSSARMPPKDLEIPVIRTAVGAGAIPVIPPAPTCRFRRTQEGVGDQFRQKAVLEVRARLLACGDGLEKVEALDDLGLRIADAKARDWPQTAAIGVRRASVDRAEAARIGGVVGEHHLQFVAAFVVEVDRTLGPVNFQRDEVVAAPGVARRLKAADGAIPKRSIETTSSSTSTAARSAWADFSDAPSLSTPPCWIGRVVT
jgi:hypothetical protein